MGAGEVVKHDQHDQGTETKENILPYMASPMTSLDTNVLVALLTEGGGGLVWRAVNHGPPPPPPCHTDAPWVCREMLTEANYS